VATFRTVYEALLEDPTRLWSPAGDPAPVRSRLAATA
jgi:hypothetical protein